MEHWKTVKYRGEEWPDYQISDLGRVASFKYDDCEFLELNLSNAGRPRVSICRIDKVCIPYVHDLVMNTFIGLKPEGMEVRHLDGNKANNELGNLVYGTHMENVRDSIKHGTHVSKRSRKISDGQRLEIRKKYAGGMGPSELAREYGVCKGTIRNALKMDVVSRRDLLFGLDKELGFPMGEISRVLDALAGRGLLLIY